MKMRGPVYLALTIAALLMAGCVSTATPADGEMEDATVEAQVPETIVVQVPMLQKETSYINEDILESYKIYHYEGANLITVELFDSFDELIEVTRFEYDGGGQEARRLIYNSDDKLRSMRTYEYDAEGRKIKEQVFNRNEELQTISGYSYRDDGELLRWDVQDAGGNLMAWSEYEYEGDLNTLINTFSADGSRQDYFVRSFRGNNLVLVDKFKADGTSAGKVEYAYSEGVLSEETYRRANGSLERTIVYQYDKEGSVIREIYKRADETVEQIIVREYTYREEERQVEE